MSSRRRGATVPLLAAVLLVSNAAAQTLDLGSEEILAGSVGYASNQCPRPLFTADGAAHVVWLRGADYGFEGVFVVRDPDGSGYGTPAMISQGLDGCRYGFGDGLTLRASGAFVVASWEGLDFANRPIWFARSTDSGASWEAADRADPETTVERAYTAGALFPDGRVAEVWMEYEEGTGDPDLFWQAQDGQGAFGAQSQPAAFTPYLPCECCNPDQVVLDDGTVLCAFRNNQNDQRRIFLSRSTDGGASFPDWVRVDTGNWYFPACPGEPPRMAVQGQNVLVAWKKAPQNSSHVWSALSTDGGVTFAEIVQVDDSDGSTQAVNPDVALRDGVAVAVWKARDPLTNHFEIWAATSIDGGASWGPQQMITGDGVNRNVAQPSVAISPTTGDVEIVWQDRRDETDKIWRIGATANATSAPRSNATPAGLRAFPNPFRGGTTLSFDLGSPHPEDLGIFDLRGRRVRGLRPEGSIFWDGRDDSGRTVPAGVYFARFEREDGAEAVRLVHLR